MKKIHFMGIGGSGMNAVAGIAHATGYDVTGCDIKESEYTADLVANGIPIAYGHAMDHLYDRDLLCVSPAVFDLNSHHDEFEYAKNHDIPVVTWQQFMGLELQKDRRVVAIAGTKGKTTTTALTGLLLTQGGLDPTVEVGGTVSEWERNYRVGEGSYFVCEADEFNNNFLHFSPEIVVITNLEFDHPEFFKSYQDYLDSYVQFIAKMPDKGILIVNNDSAGVIDLLKKVDATRITVITYGTARGVQFQLSSYKVIDHKSTFAVEKAGIQKEYASSLIGEHNALNALSVIILGEQLGISDVFVRKLLEDFQGVGRRFELVCKKGNILIYNDYAHNPMSVRAVLKSARDLYPEHRIWAVFQPHLYSRTKMFLDDFALSFENSDMVVISDIFASREKGKLISEEVHSKDLVARIHQLNPSVKARYGGTLEDTIDLLMREIGEDDVIVNMGAGDNGIISEAICQKIQ